MKIGQRHFDFEKHAYIMGILNVTPDSFSDGGKYSELDQAMKQAEKMIEEGADIIDIGGESTRPGHDFVSAEEEINRIAPVIEHLKKNFDTPISLDTYKSETARAGILAGADLINDVWGLKWDYSMARVMAEYDIPVCLMHNRKDTDYKDYLNDIKTDVKEIVKLALEAGIKEEHIILDPGIGFAKNLEQNLLLMKHLDLFQAFGYPVLLGTSRKSMIGLTLNLPADQREEGTIATTVLGYEKGCRIFRVHDVKSNVRALKMTEAILGME